MISELFSMYRPSYARSLTYMLQSVEYQALPFLGWFWATRNFSNIEYRRQLQLTGAAKIIKLGVQICLLLLYAIGLSMILADVLEWTKLLIWPFGASIIAVTPLLTAHLLLLPILFGKWFVVNPRRRRYLAKSEIIFARHPGVKIAIVGSYGKTSMKELLNTVLGSELLVAATPANENVAISHARFAHTLSGKEAVLLIEYGEGAPGDVASLARLTHPTHAIITGLAPAHLDKYKTLEAAAQDIFSIRDYVKPSRLFVAGDCAQTGKYVKKGNKIYNADGVLGWKIDKVKLSIDGTTFRLHKDDDRIVVRSKLLGQHQIAPLALSAILAKLLGVDSSKIEQSLASFYPYQHRMQPYQLGGAWIIDDTYNGNIEGIRAGTALLSVLKAQRKIYVTPGLVDQGKQSNQIHQEVGKLIAAAKPDIVVLMQNSATSSIKSGLLAANYLGELRIETRPLDFYSNLQSFVATGDIVLMQNDWTDNYR